MGQYEKNDNIINNINKQDEQSRSKHKTETEKLSKQQRDFVDMFSTTPFH